MGDICSESKLGNLQLFFIYLIWESLKISVGKNLFFNWENWEHHCKILK